MPSPNPDPDDRAYRKVINAWAMYDWGNSAFPTTIVAAVFPVFYRELALTAGVSPKDAIAYWGYTNSVALLLVALLGPVLGAVAARSFSRRSTGGCIEYVDPGRRVCVLAAHRPVDISGVLFL